MSSSHCYVCAFAIGEQNLMETIDRLRAEEPSVSGALVRSKKGRFSKAADVWDPNLQIFFPLRGKFVVGLSVKEQQRFRGLHPSSPYPSVVDYIVKLVTGVRQWFELGKGVHYLDIGDDPSKTYTIKGKLAFALKDCWEPLQKELMAAYKKRFFFFTLHCVHHDVCSCSFLFPVLFSLSEPAAAPVLPPSHRSIRRLSGTHRRVKWTHMSITIIV